MEVLRFAAFATQPQGGNPAGVVLDARGADAAQMAAIAAEVGYSETAFVMPRDDGRLDVRYFSPKIEVPFCGHATIATAVAHARLHGAGHLIFHTQAGTVPVCTSTASDGSVIATLTSVRPRTVPLTDSQLTALLAVLGWTAAELDPTLPPRAAYAGAWHPILAAADRTRLGKLDYDLAELADLMNAHGWATIDMVWRETPTLFHARNAFAPGGVIEDPATGAAAAALGGYLREQGLITVPAELTVLQGHDMGRPSTITVTVPADPDSGIAVTGTAVPI